MKRPLVWLVAIVLASGCCGKQTTPAVDPFFGRTTVPPPGTGSIGYQPGAAAPGALQPIPQPQVSIGTPVPAPGYPAGAASGGVPAYAPSTAPAVTPTPAYPPATTPGTSVPYPSASPPAGTSPSTPYAPPGGFNYQGTSVGRSGNMLARTAPRGPSAWPASAAPAAGADTAASPSIIRIPVSDESLRPVEASPPVEATVVRTPIIRTLQPRAREAATSTAGVVSSDATLAPTSAAAPTPVATPTPAPVASAGSGQPVDIMDLPEAPASATPATAVPAADDAAR